MHTEEGGQVNIILVDIDSKPKIGNLVLMNISRYHQSKGNNVALIQCWQRGDMKGKLTIPVEIYTTDFDWAYISCIYRQNRDYAMKIRDSLRERGIGVSLGGTGINLTTTVGPWMEKLMPDYDLYPSRKSIGATTKGCVRKCPFCVVPQKEGSIHQWMHPKDFYDPRFPEMILLDNNWYADKKYWFHTTDWLIDNNIRVNAIQGLDARLLTMEIARRLKELKWWGQMHFAFDNMADEQAVRDSIAMLKKAGMNIRRNVTYYVLVGHDTTIEEDIYRCRLLKKLGTNAFVMPYKRTVPISRLARWSNKPQLYWSFDIDEYVKGGIRGVGN